MPARYLSDLTDAQWDRVRSAALPGAADARAGRRTIDGLRFRAAAWCPWELLPADFPPAPEVRDRYRAWVADGTWGRVAAAADPPPVDPPPPFRRRVARVLKSFPGGRLALRPARALIQFAQAVHRQATPHVRLPAIFRDGVLAMQGGDLATAVARFTRVIELDPANGEARLNLGLALERAGRAAGARDALLAALTVPRLAPPARAAANAGLAAAYLRLGDLDRAAGHAYQARLLARYGEHAPWDRDGPPAEADEYELLSDALGELAERALRLGDAPFLALSARRDRVRDDYARWLGAEAGDALYLPEEWVRAIGHMALIDFWAKLDRLGWLGRGRVVLHAPPATVANAAYLKYYRPLVRVVPDPDPNGATARLAAALGPRISAPVRIPGQPDRVFLASAGVVQAEWERQGRAPLLALDAADREHGAGVLRELGLPAGAWFVSLHVRSPGFHREGERSPHAHRNADIATYRGLVAEVGRRGGWVVRVGDPTMPPAPAAPNVIDYAHSPLKSDRTDIYLCAACRVFVGVASGLGNVPTTFGVPCLMTNWVANVLPVAGRNDLFVPKRVRRQADGRVLGFDEWLDPANRSRYILATDMAAAGLQPVDNTPDELHEAMAEMLDRLDGASADTPDDLARQAAFEAVARRHDVVGVARIGRDFLRRHAALLPDAPARRAG